MFLACGVGAFTVGMFHVMTHAFFKACLFLGAGCVMHAMHDDLNVHHMGGLKKKMPITYMTFLIATLAISGIPPFAGFFSKDAILSSAFESHEPLGKVFWAIGLFTAGLTALYMFRVVSLTFLGRFRGTPEQEHHLHEAPRSMTGPIIVLAILATVGGWVGLPAVFGENANLFARFLSPIVTPIAGRELAHEALPHAVEWLLMAVSVAVAASGLYLAWVWWGKGEGRVPARLAATYPALLRPPGRQVAGRRAVRLPLRQALRVAGARPLESRGRPHHRRRPERHRVSGRARRRLSPIPPDRATSETTR